MLVLSIVQSESMNTNIEALVKCSNMYEYA